MTAATGGYLPRPPHSDKGVGHRRRLSRAVLKHLSEYRQWMLPAKRDEEKALAALLAARRDLDVLIGAHERFMKANAVKAGATSGAARNPDVSHLGSANAERIRSASEPNAKLAEAALAILGEQCKPGHRIVAEARIANPAASWSEIGAAVGLSKHQAAGRFQRMLVQAQQMAPSITS